MNYREAAAYANRSTIELKTEFEDILEAMEAIGQSKSISIDMMDFWLNGSTLVNYEIYLRQLNVEKLLSDNGIPKEHIRNVLQSDTIDRYVLFKNACLSFIGEDLTADFKELIINPITKMYIKPHEVNKAHSAKQLKVARGVIIGFKPALNKAILDIRKLEPHTIAGTFEETILLKLEQVQHLIINQLI
ncbi:MAG: hypothetical protein COB17_02415 [Sulfurimonas sp.]|nr:MAG: hypothetical protein COB17_02415 [Sulfurimonas sp.]